MMSVRPAAMAAVLLASAALVAVAAPVAPAGAAEAPAPLATAAIADVGGAARGSARIVAGTGGPVLMVDLNGVAQGMHGMHFHAVGDCGGAGFAAAGGHLNPNNRQHGSHNPRGSHLGDLPNVTANDAGEVHATVALPMSVGKLRAALFDADGTALVVHAGPDDYMTDPAGGSGARIACGVFMAR